ncbi:MAG: hypothetical protein CML50_04260 [Rhodobacteraceae bacterium]|jgi:multisubunit Na+/H+ antiporter MnhG subunit|uniref:Uncharacterized protein n=1 Tax=Salipiger profundus TaxID=1229727 RepID=A0A1U7D295_9RHOB|nr:MULTISPECIES: hypothetical protein [Salipiger]APX22205.1 putative exported protein of unknown function [Salipiger profundus]MAB05218.1 hypothetical protein [Paracoccaceae bacterium]GGA08237.1 hypothetical protein GCM10011326_20180 [Salipiger profundus]SFC48479.1 hypothetical protein SAMN05444415_103386 [Salipiger profundus]
MRRAVRLASWLLPPLVAVWVFLANPFGAAMLERGIDEIARALDRAVAGAVSSGELERTLAEAVAVGDARRADALLTLAERRDVSLPTELEAEAATLAGRNDDWLATGKSCALCAYEVAECRSLSQLAVCALPLEMTPAGDANALRRQVGVYASGGEVDRLEVGLALTGLAATAAVLMTAGSSATVKAGATAARLANRLGTLTPGLRTALRSAGDVPVRWDRLNDFALRRVPLEAVTDVGALQRLGGMAADAGRVAEHSSVADALVLVRYADTPSELARLARVTEATGEEARGLFALLGKSRVMRATLRLPRRVLALHAMLAGAVAWLLSTLAGMALGRVARLGRRL